MNNISVGSWITLNNTSVAEIMADAGFDWLCIDIEHSSIDYSEVQNLIMAIQGRGLKAFVRVGENNSRIIKRVLDAGADGIIIPSINSVNMAINAIQYIKYPPLGKRGVGLSRAQSYGFDFDNYYNIKAKNIKIIVQIEHIDAINDLDKILQLDGIDGTFIGPYDLSGSLGVPGEFDNVLVKSALEKYEKITKNYDKLIGYHVVQPNYELVIDKINKGYNFIAFGFDGIFLGTIIRNQLKEIKK
jgi:2-dehydro-3-deoxyglucarate aldolase